MFYLEQVALTTLCGVFLNFIVMETELVSTDPVFTELLSFLITTLPSVGEGEIPLYKLFYLNILGEFVFLW